jgi:hypothetical protein
MSVLIDDPLISMMCGLKLMDNTEGGVMGNNSGGKKETATASIIYHVEVTISSWVELRLQGQ